MLRSLPFLALVAACRPAELPVAAVNDLRTSAGTVRGDTLIVDLSVRMMRWFPASDSGPSLVVAGFAEDGKAPSTPGPLIRVPVGTNVAVSLTNSFDDTLFVSGLRDPASWDTLVVPPGKRVTSSFKASRAGTFVYQGGTRALLRGPGEQLSGVIVVDSAGAPPERILVIGSWNGAPVPPSDDSAFVMVINGKTWPYTERFRVTMGDTVRWRLVSVSLANHPMHLHGGYFRVESNGDARGDRQFAPAERFLAATETLWGQQSRTISWTPTHPGGWLFHCHDAFHVQASQHQDIAGGPRAPDHVHADVASHLARGMAGLIIGIEVDGPAATAPMVSRRHLGVDVVTKERSNGAPWIGFATPGDTLMIPGKPLILTRGEPVAITVRNRTSEPTSVHWHGIELESYYDGVAGWSGTAAMRAPLIAPGDSFVALMTPPRAGTFMYHGHVSEPRIIASGMFGGLVVLEPGQRWNPERDHLLIYSQQGEETPTDSGLIVLNNGRKPALPPLTAGVPHRFRFINISAGDAVGFRLSQGDSTIKARVIARDGMNLPAHQSVMRPMVLQMGTGETMDFEVVLRRGPLRIGVKSFNDFETMIDVK